MKLPKTNPVAAIPLGFESVVLGNFCQLVSVTQGKVRRVERVNYVDKHDLRFDGS